MKSLKGRVAIVTASAGAGNGQCALRALAKDGASVVVTDVHERRTKEVADALKAEGCKAIGILCDVTKRDQVDNLVKKTMEEWGRIDILVNNAGRNALGPFLELTEANWRLVFDVCVTSAFFCTQAVLPIMKKQNYGRIINVSSVAGWGNAPNDAAYCTAKAGLQAFTRCIGVECGKQDITCNAIAIGVIPNPFTIKIYGEEGIKAQVASQTKGRGGTFDEYGNLVLYLASEECSYVNGETIAFCGGTNSSR